ncbi:MAG: hypothetical protein Q7R87_02270 [Nanoarchaeota archaeon]|nr:hypothetical protein [Nanoarchaeota archaeon]
MKYEILRKLPKYVAGAIALYTILHFTEQGDIREVKRERQLNMMNLPEYAIRAQQKGTNDLTKQQELEMIVKNSGFP